MMPPTTQQPILVAHPSADLYGSDRVLLESVSGLVEAGWDVVVTVPADGSLLPLLRERGARIAICPTPVVRRSILRPLGLLGFIRDVARGLCSGRRLMMRERPAVVYVNTLTIPLWVLLARLMRVPAIAHVHEAEKSASWVLRKALARPLLSATRVIANSRFSAGVLTDSYPRLAGRTTIILNGVPGPIEARIARPAIIAPVELVYVGRLSPRKGVDIAIDAVRRLSDRGIDARLRLVGAVFPGYEWYEAELRAQASAVELDGRIVFAGFQKRVWDLIGDADVVLVPSRVDEPFGNTAVEAILSGRPVIASATSGLLEATEGYAAARTVDPGESVAVADEVQKLIHDWDLVREQAWEDRTTASQRHSPELYRAAISHEVGQLVSHRAAFADLT